MLINRKALAILAVAMMLACAVPVTSDGTESDALGDASGVLIYQVNPKGDSDKNGEGFSLKNYSSKEIDLKGYSVSDGDREGLLKFNKSFKLGAGQVVTLVNAMSDILFCKQSQNITVTYKDIDDKKQITLGDSGDNLILKDPMGKVVDYLRYGSFKTTNDPYEKYWFGDNAKVSGIYERHGSDDTDSAEDWFKARIGQTENFFDSSLRFDATVIPFLFPESGGIPVYQALESAQTSVWIEIYELRSANVYGLLAQLLDRGVEVRLLHEGMPIGNTVPANMSQLMRFLEDKGGEVRLIGGQDSDRYENVHAKYAIIDGKKLIFTSENWSHDNMNGHIDDDPYKGRDGNRGWGAIVESVEYAEYMMKVFENDWSLEYGDTVDFEKEYPTATARECYYVAPESATFTSYNTQISPILSNDNSRDTIYHYIDSAEVRCYSEQQKFDGDYSVVTNEGPLNHMAQRAAAGVDTRLVMGGESRGKDNSGIQAIVDTINGNSKIKAAMMPDPYVHNKGIVCDDVTIVCSINWTPTSLLDNRESGVVIHSKEISDFYAASFEKDFDRYYTYDGVSIDTSSIKNSYSGGTEHVFEIQVKPEGDYTYTWDFGDGTVRTTTIPKVAYQPADGAHVLTITVTDKDGNPTKTAGITYTVGDDGTDILPGGAEEFLDGISVYLIPVIVVILAIIAAVVRKLR